MTAEGQVLVGRLAWEAIRGAGLQVGHVGGLTLGADPVAYAVAHHSWSTPLPLDAFTIRKAPKAHGTGQRIEGGLPAGARVVVVEDAMTTGGSALEAIRVLREEGAQVLAALTVVDREEGAAEALADAGIPTLLRLVRASELLNLAEASRTRLQSSNLRGITRHR